MTHIALLLPDLEIGGAQRVILQLAKEFLSRGHRVDLVLLKTSGPMINNIPNNISITSLPTCNYLFGNIGFTIVGTFWLTKWLNKERPEVLLSTITGANLVAILTKKFASYSFRVVVREASTLKNIKSKIRLKAMRWLYPQADAIIALSNIMKEELHTKINISRTKIVQIPNPVNIDAIESMGKEAVTHPWLDDKSLNVIISVGRLIPPKDYPTLLTAFSLLPEPHKYRLIIVGDGPERNKLLQQAEKLGISKRVQFIGFDLNPWRWMSKSDLFCLTSIWEGYPNVLLEALAIGMSIVATSYDPSIEELSKAYNFTIVPTSDPKALASAITTLIGSRSKPKLISQKNNLNKIIDDYLEVVTCNAID